MSVRVLLDKPYTHFTNLDFITGRVLLTLPTETPISSIVVKLEGESRTRLAGPKYPHGERPEKKRTEIEVHKLLYKVATVFPSSEIREQVASTVYYTLPPGTYEYPFRFKFPFNNDCANNQLATANLNVGSLRLEVVRPSHYHVRKTLPPSMSGFPGEAEIRYYVKATVVRPQFYKENYRSISDFKFLPIEPPRQKEQDKETYARRQHQFSKAAHTREKKNPFGKSSIFPIESSEEPPRFSVDVRLPSPAILTCNEPVPLRILITKLNESSEPVSVQVLQIELIGYTHIRAHDFRRTESGNWVILSRSNMGLHLRNESKPVGYEWKLDQNMWNSLPLPNSVAPSFDTCNISRTYELEVRVGLSHGSLALAKPELMIIPLRLPVQVYSGIAPPKALLEAMGVNPEKEPEAVPPPPPPRPSVPDYVPPPGMEPYEDAPPSYEDAMAEALGPVDGPRREYNPPDTTSGRSDWTGTDVKRSVDTNKDDDRLFPDSGTRNASTDSLEVYYQSPVDSSPSTPTVQNQPKQRTSQAVQSSDALESQSDIRPMRVNPFMGVPPRKPVPDQDKPNSGKT
ncbi:hypothetical protein VTO42DRAFT_3670 [Malbranchea cinnamomea]